MIKKSLYSFEKKFSLHRRELRWRFFILHLIAIILSLSSLSCSVFEAGGDGSGSGSSGAMILLGQSSESYRSCYGSTLSYNTLCEPSSTLKIGTQWFISDAGNKRVIVSKDSFTSSSYYELLPPRTAGKVVGADVISRAGQIATDGSKLVVVDSDNNRALVWSTIPFLQKSADVVIGQSDFSGFSANLGTSTAQMNSLSAPTGAVVVSGHLYICDRGNSRILGFNTIPTSSGTRADFVLTTPCYFLSTNGFNLTVATDTGYQVKIWSAAPTSGSTPVDLVLGSGVSGTTSTSFNKPVSTAWADNRLYLADGTNNKRILYWDSPSGSNLDADGYLEVADTVSVGTSVDPFFLHFDDIDRQLLTIEKVGHRLLKYIGVPSTSSTAYEALGQSSLTNQYANRESTKNGFSPEGGNDILGVDDSIFVGDYRGRVLGYKRVSLSSPYIVLGQSDLVTDCVNGVGCGPTAVQTGKITGLAKDSSGRIYVSDGLNNRVLVFSSTPTATGAAADFVIGQPSKTVGTANNGGISAASLSSPEGVWVKDTYLYVADTGNHRVLRYDLPITADSPSATLVLGQASFSTATSSTTSSGLTSPRSIITFQDKLIINDNGNHRVLIFTATPTASGTAADVVLGQTDMTSSSVGDLSSLSKFSSDLGTSMVTFDSKLILSDRTYQRILAFSLLEPTSGMAASWSITGHFTPSSLYTSDSDGYLWILEGGGGGNNRVLGIDKSTLSNYWDK